MHVCKTEFWVIQQNRKHFGFHFRLGDPTDHDFRPGKSPEEYYIRDWYRDQSPPTDRPKSTPDFRSIADSTYRTQLPTRQEVAPDFPHTTWNQFSDVIQFSLSSCAAGLTPQSWVMVFLARETSILMIKEI